MPIMQTKNILQKILLISAGVLLLLVALAGAGRNRAVRTSARRILRPIAEKKQLDIRYRDIRMEGLSTLVIEGLTVVPRQERASEGRADTVDSVESPAAKQTDLPTGCSSPAGLQRASTLRSGSLPSVSLPSDTFLIAERLRITLDLKRLFRLQVSVRDIRSDRLHIHFIKKGAVSNFDFLYPSAPTPAPEKPDEEPDEKPNGASEPDAETDAPETRHYARKAEQTLNMLFRWIPANASIRNLCVFYSNKGDELRLEIPSFTVKDHQFLTEIRSTENGRSDEWIAQGTLLKKEKQLYATLHAKGDAKITLPFLAYRWNTSVQFDTLAFEWRGRKETPAIQRVRGKAYVSGLTLRQPRLSSDTVRVDRGMLAFDVRIGKNWIEMDSTSEVRFNRLHFHPYLRMEKDSAWHLTASVNKTDFEANDLFASLPAGLFSNLDGLQTEGALSYRFRCDIDWGRLDSLVLESSLQARNFRILAYGNTDLRKMNEPFLYTVYEHGEPLRSFEIGPANPSFRAFHAVSRYLPLAILQSEDAGFFYHNGFIPSAIRESLILDLKERRFARGGSTLSMQLVKNVFLSRNKTIARKLEEMLIVWLIESNRLTSKERMFEVYLNIAEWGPGVYGAAEASRFYFAKDPSQLTLSESIFLASIIPKPKHVRFCFDGLSLKPSYEAFYQVIVGRMLERGLITGEEAEEARPEAVRIAGPARSYLSGDAAPDAGPGSHPDPDLPATETRSEPPSLRSKPTEP